MRREGVIRGWTRMSYRNFTIPRSAFVPAPRCDAGGAPVLAFYRYEIAWYCYKGAFGTNKSKGIADLRRTTYKGSDCTAGCCPGRPSRSLKKQKGRLRRTGRDNYHGDSVPARLPAPAPAAASAPAAAVCAAAASEEVAPAPPPAATLAAFFPPELLGETLSPCDADEAWEGFVLTSGGSDDDCAAVIVFDGAAAPAEPQHAPAAGFSETDFPALVGGAWQAAIQQRAAAGAWSNRPALVLPEASDAPAAAGSAAVPVAAAAATPKGEGEEDMLVADSDGGEQGDDGWLLVGPPACD